VEILLLHPGGLGDIILSLPAVALIRERYPSSRIIIAGNTDHLAAIVSNYAEKAVSLATLPIHRLYAHESISENDVRFWNSFDRILSWTGSGDPDFSANFSRIHPNVRVGTWRPMPEETRHVSRLFIDSLNFGIPPGIELTPAHIRLDSRLSEEGAQWLASHGWSRPEPLIALHPGAGSDVKRWPIDRFINLALRLAVQEKLKVFVVGGPAEAGLAEQIAQALPEADVIRADCLPLNLLASTLQQCQGFVGNDSGVAHLAAALGVPSVVLFGPTLPQHWAPLGRHVTVLRNPRACRGCISGSSEHTCLSNLTVEEVIENLILNSGD
jgi:heptosyltransferase-3